MKNEKIAQWEDSARTLQHREVAQLGLANGFCNKDPKKELNLDTICNGQKPVSNKVDSNSLTSFIATKNMMLIKE